MQSFCTSQHASTDTYTLYPLHLMSNLQREPVLTPYALAHRDLLNQWHYTIPSTCCTKNYMSLPLWWRVQKWGSQMKYSKQSDDSNPFTTREPTSFIKSTIHTFLLFSAWFSGRQSIYASINMVLERVQGSNIQLSDKQAMGYPSPHVGNSTNLKPVIVFSFLPSFMKISYTVDDS